MNSETGERERLIALLAALEEPTLAIALPEDDPMLTAVARHHRLTPLLSITCGTSLPVTLAEAFRRDRIVTTARGMILAQVAAECIRALAAGGVPAIVLKGLAYETQLYRAPGARPTADADLLIPNEMRRAAFAILDRLGFEPRAAAPGFDDPDYHEVAWTRAGVEIDLHLALAPLARCRIDYPAIWREAETLHLGGSDALALATTHAAVFQALHMAIDHFDVPAIYLVDLSRLLPDEAALDAARDLARRWHCRRPLETAAALAASFLPGWLPAPANCLTAMRARIVAGYGTSTGIPRSEQIVRKLGHFDAVEDALRYVVVQLRRNAREAVQRRLLKRSARERLGLGVSGARDG
jgi:hypothetical protein